MNAKLFFFHISLILVVGIAMLIYGFDCSSTDKVQSTIHKLHIGMSEREVVQILGEPDRKLILIGKALHEIENNASEFDLKKNRLVYSYEELGVQVWFLEGKVTGATRNGVSIF